MTTSSAFVPSKDKENDALLRILGSLEDGTIVVVSIYRSSLTSGSSPGMMYLQRDYTFRVKGGTLEPVSSCGA